MVLFAVSESNSAPYVNREEWRNGIFHDLSVVHWAVTREKNHACYINITLQNVILIWTKLHGLLSKK
jgi:hypothetical protein